MISIKIQRLSSEAEALKSELLVALKNVKRIKSRVISTEFDLLEKMKSDRIEKFSTEKFSYETGIKKEFDKDLFLETEEYDFVQLFYKTKEVSTLSVLEIKKNQELYNKYIKTTDTLKIKELDNGN